MFRTSNPTISGLRYAQGAKRKAATYKGISLKTLILLGITAISAVVSVYLQGEGYNGWGASGVYWGIDIVILILLASFIGFLCALLSSLIPRVAMFLSPVYAVCEGLVIGFFSVMFEGIYSGVVFAALMSTVITFGVIVVLHRFEAFRATGKLKQILFTLLVTLSVTQFIYVITSFLYGSVIYDFTQSFWLQLFLSTVMILLACTCLLVDLQNVDDFVNSDIDKKYEWVASLGILVSLVWLYLQFLRLFALLGSRRT